MVLLKCSLCGLETESSKISPQCPMCGGELLPVESATDRLPENEDSVTAAVEETEFVHLEIEKAKYYKIALPAFEDESKIESATENIKLYLENASKKYPEEMFSLLWIFFSDKVYRITKDRDSMLNARATAALNATREFIDTTYGSSSKSNSPGLGFSIITNSTVDAATYIGLAAHEAKMSKARQELAATKKLNQQIRGIATGGTGASQEFFDAVDKLVYYFVSFHNAYTFMNAHRDFYNNHKKYDVGVSMEGINIYQLLAHAANSPSRFIGNYKTLQTKVSEKDLELILPQLHAAGYIHYFKIDWKTSCYITTGKYESTILRQQFWNTHPEEKIAEDDRKEKQYAEKYAKAETALNNGNFYEAAVTFAQIDGYRDAIQRSMMLWKEKLQTNRWSISIGSHAITSDGKVLLSQSLGKPEVQNQWKRLKDIKQLENLGYGQYVAIDFNGHLKSYITLKQWQPIKQLELEKHKVVAISHPWNKCIAFLLEDGTVRFIGELEYEIESTNRKVKETPTLSGWSSITKIELYHNSIVALRKDGTILAAGYVSTYSEKFRNWKGIIDVKIGLGGRYIVAQTQDGKILVAGNEPDNYNVVTTWKDVIDVYTDNSVPMGITRNGLLLWGSDKVKKTPALAQICTLRGVVSISGRYSDYIALKADGTVYTTATGKDYSDWKNVVSINSDISYDYALCSNGSILVKTKNTGKEHAALEAKTWKLFSHIDTFQHDLQIAQDNVTKVVKEENSNRGVFWLWLGAVLVIVGILFCMIGNKKLGLIGILGGILGIIIWAIEHGDAMQNH